MAKRVTVSTNIVLTLFINSRQWPTRLSRVCAFLLMSTVLMLAVFAASPEAHHWLHADADHQDHECAITLYVQGVTTALVSIVLAIVAWRWLGLSIDVETGLSVSEPRYLHLPGRAPPQG